MSNLVTNFQRIFGLSQ